MTHEEILNRFKNKFPSATISDFRPICHKEFTDEKQGITVWLDDGAVIEYYPQEEIVEEETVEKKAEIELKILKSKIDFLEKDVERLYLNSNWIIDKLREKGIVTLKDIAGKE